SEVDLLQAFLRELSHLRPERSKAIWLELLDLAQIGALDVVTRGIGRDSKNIGPLGLRRLLGRRLRRCAADREPLRDLPHKVPDYDEADNAGEHCHKNFAANHAGRASSAEREAREIRDWP